MPGNQQNPFGAPEPERKSNQHEKSGFSLSNFAPVGGADPFAQAGRSSALGNTNDFFAGFENKQSVKSRQSGPSQKEETNQKMKNTRDFFADFNVTNRS